MALALVTVADPLCHFWLLFHSLSLSLCQCHQFQVVILADAGVYLLQTRRVVTLVAAVSLSFTGGGFCHTERQ